MEIVLGCSGHYIDPTYVSHFDTFLKRGCEMTKFEVMWRTREPDDNFPFFSSNFRTFRDKFISAMFIYIVFTPKRLGVIAKLLE